MKKALLLIAFSLVFVLISCTNNQNTTKPTSREMTTMSPMDLYINQMENPYNVALFVTEDLSTSVGVNFEMPSDTVGYVEYAVLGENKYLKVRATQKEAVFEDETAYLYEITLSGLEPNTMYQYRVVNEDLSESSSYYQFSTANPNAETSQIMFLADPQENAEVGYMTYAYSILSVIDYADADIDLMMLPGDLVNDRNVRSEWNLFFKYSSMFSTSLPMAVAIGNHEMPLITETSVNHLAFDAYMNLPNTGPVYERFSAVKGDQRDRQFDQGKTYSFDYGDAHIVVINSETYCDGTLTCTKVDTDNANLLNTWLRNDLNQTEKEWKIVMLHRGPYGLSYDTVGVRDYLVPVLEDCNVDLVLSGHEHQYSRAVYWDEEMIDFSSSNDYLFGTISLINDDLVNINFNKYSSSIGITYLTSNTTATKFYGGIKTSEIDVNYAFIDAYPVIPILTISENQIKVTSYAVVKASGLSIIPEEVIILEEFTLIN